MKLIIDLTLSEYTAMETAMQQILEMLSDGGDSKWTRYLSKAYHKLSEARERHLYDMDDHEQHRINLCDECPVCYAEFNTWSKEKDKSILHEILPKKKSK